MLPLCALRISQKKRSRKSQNRRVRGTWMFGIFSFIWWFLAIPLGFSFLGFGGYTKPLKVRLFPEKLETAQFRLLRQYAGLSRSSQRMSTPNHLLAGVSFAALQPQTATPKQKKGYHFEEVPL